MVSNEKILVGLTTWRKRVHNVMRVLDSIMHQTIVPDEIILSVSTQDFPHMRDDFPEDLNQYIDNNPKIKLKWFVENYKGWKKHLGMLECAEDDDLMICIDDDHLYPGNFIEILYKSYLFYGKRHPVTWNRLHMFFCCWPFCGMGTMYRKKDWGRYQVYLTHDILCNTLEDMIIQMIFSSNFSTIYPIIYDVPKHETFELKDDCAMSFEQGINDRLTYTFERMNDLMSVYYYEHSINADVNDYSPVFWYAFGKHIDVMNNDNYPATKYININLRAHGLYSLTDVDANFVNEYLSKKYE